MKKKTTLKFLLSFFLLASCSKESPELIPCMCDGSESTLGMFDCMCEPMKKKPVRRISYLQDRTQPRYQTLIIDDSQYDAYIYLHHRRDSFAPVKLEYVDFRIQKGRKYDEFENKLGNYRFRIFGCRRESRNVFLNQGRAMQKDMRFFDVFYETMNDYYPVVVDKKSPYYMDSDKHPYPEYIITAEITDYFMNICDEFDWNNVKQKKLRSGSSEMTVVWRVMNLARDEVYCKGVTTGYGQISEGEPNGETLLVERAFEDALIKLPEIDCFNSTLAQRIRPEDIQRQLAYLQSLDARNQTFASQYDKEIKGVNLLQNCASGIGNNVDQAGGSSATGKTIKTRNGKTAGLAIDDNCRAIEIVDDGCTVVKTIDDKVTIADDYWLDVPLNTADEKLIANRNMVESSFANINNSFCIENQPPYENLNPYNLYKVRASIISVENAEGKKGAGLIIADNLVLTSADLMVKGNNNFNLQTINGKKFKGAAFRVNPNKNVALLLLDEPTEYTPLPLSLSLPEVNKDILLTLGLLDLDTEGEGYIDNEGRVTGYRWSEERGAEIIADTFVQTVTLGGALIDKNGNIVGLAHTSKKVDDSPDLFIPVETALKGLGLEICGRKFENKKPAAVKTYETPLADAIDNSKADKTPAVIKDEEKK